LGRADLIPGIAKKDLQTELPDYLNSVLAVWPVWKLARFNTDHVVYLQHK
jgi:hypothetical protein